MDQFIPPPPPRPRPTGSPPPLPIREPLGVLRAASFSAAVRALGGFDSARFFATARAAARSLSALLVEGFAGLLIALSALALRFLSFLSALALASSGELEIFFGFCGGLGTAISISLDELSFFLLE